MDGVLINSHQRRRHRSSNPSRHVVSIPVSSAVSRPTDDFSEFMADDSSENEDVPLGDALEKLAVDVRTNAVEAVRDVCKRP